MAETITLNGYEFKKRSPLAVWLLSLFTVYIYYFVWYFKINREARDYLGGGVRRAIVDHQALKHGMGLRKDAMDSFLDVFSPVVDGDHCAYGAHRCACSTR